MIELSKKDFTFINTSDSILIIFGGKTKIIRNDNKNYLGITQAIKEEQWGKLLTLFSDAERKLSKFAKDKK